jgi:hypothetical protein
MDPKHQAEAEPSKSFDPSGQILEPHRIDKIAEKSDPKYCQEKAGKVQAGKVSSFYLGLRCWLVHNFALPSAVT